MTVGENIRRFRKEKNLTQKALGELVGVAQNTVTQWENSTNSPKMPQIDKLAEILGIKATDLLPGDFSAKTEDRQALTETFRYAGDALLQRALDELDPILASRGYCFDIALDIESESGYCLIYPDGYLALTREDLQTLYESINSYILFSLSELKRKRLGAFHLKPDDSNHLKVDDLRPYLKDIDLD